MKPSRGEKAPVARFSTSRSCGSESGRLGSVGRSRDASSRSGAGRMRWTRMPPWGLAGMLLQVSQCLEFVQNPRLLLLGDGIDLLRGEVSEPLQGLQDLARALLESFSIRVRDDVRIQRWLVRIRDAGEVGQLSPQRLLIQPFHVPPDPLLERTVNVDFHKAPNLGPRLLPHTSIR